MSRLKLVTIVGTRPELIKLSEVIKKADEFFDHTFIHTGQNYDANLNDIFYEDLGLRKPDMYLDVVGENLGETVGNVIAKSYRVLGNLKPDAVLILGDTNSALSAIAAKRLKIPVFHMEAGNRCFDENVSEEINRRIVDHISDIHLPYTEHARRNLLAEGIKGEFVFVTGSPMREVIAVNTDKIMSSEALRKVGVEKGKYFLLSSHREENIDNNCSFNNLMEAINALAEDYQLPVIYSVHPRSAKFIKERNVRFHRLVHQMPPFCFTDYMSLQNNAFCVVSDSGTLAEESSICHFPAVSIRTSTERPEAVDCGSFLLGGITTERLLRSVKMSTTSKLGDDIPAYSSDAVSDNVVKIIQGYVSLVDDLIWRKN